MTDAELNASEQEQKTAAEAASDGRVYVHGVCGQMTRIRGRHFVSLCDPFRFVPRTKCGACGTSDASDLFYWSDSGESIANYRDRMRNEAPAFCRVWIYALAPLVSGVIGIDLIHQLRRLFSIPGNLWLDVPVGLVVLVPLFSVFIAPAMMQALLRPSFHQKR